MHAEHHTGGCDTASSAISDGYSTVKSEICLHSDRFTRITPGSSHDGLAQLAARQIVALEVMGSNPISVTQILLLCVHLHPAW